MAYLAVVGSKAVNGVAAIHSEIIKDTIFKARARPRRRSAPCLATRAQQLRRASCERSCGLRWYPLFPAT
jgi:hypothetical protein